MCMHSIHFRSKCYLPLYKADGAVRPPNKQFASLIERISELKIYFIIIPDQWIPKSVSQY